MSSKLKCAQYLMTLLICGLFGGPAAHACDELKIHAVPTVSLVETSNPQQIRIDIRKTGPACSFFLTFGRSNGSFNRTVRLDGHEVSYNLYRTTSLSAVLKDIPEASPEEVINGSFTLDGDQTKSIEVIVSYTPQRLKPPGPYTDSIEVGLHKGAYSASSAPSDRKILGIAHLLPVLREISVVGSGSAFNAYRTSQNLQFGTLSEGKTQSVDVLVRSNSGYKVFLSSRHDGRLQNARLANQFVPYQLRAEGTLVNLGQSGALASEVARGTGATTLDGDRIPVAVTIGETKKSLAGDYTDFITVTVEAN